MPFFSVVIPTYNRAALLEECLASVFAQAVTDFEVIVVDDGSSDRTSEIVARYADRIQVLRQGNSGPAAARNAGIREARGHYVAFLDSDDVWFPWTLSTYGAAIDLHGRPSFVAGKPFRFREGERPEPPQSPRALEAFADYFAASDEWRWWGTSSFVVRTDALATVGGFTDQWINGEDADLAMRLGDARGFVQIRDPYTFGYREHAGTAIADFPRTLAGAWHALRTEQRGGYPGGERRAAERRRILTRQLRPVMIECLRSDKRADAWQMYRATLGWHLHERRWRFVAGFPLLALRAS